MVALRKWWQDTREQCRKHPGAALCLLGAYVVMMCLAGYYFGYRNWWASQRWKEAQQSLATDDFMTARSRLDDCLTIWNNDGQTQFVMAQTCRRLGDFEAGSQHLDQARRLGYSPLAIAVESVLTEVQRSGGTSAELTVLKPYLESRTPEEPLIMEALVIGQHRQRRYRDAAAWLNRWVTLYPGDWRAFHYRASFFHETGRLEMAQQDFQQALELRPDQLDAQRGLGVVLTKTGADLERAIQVLLGYLQHRPQDTEAQIALARAYRRATHFKEARDTLSRLVAARMESASLSLAMGQLEADEDNLPRALHWLELAEKQGTESAEEINFLYSSLGNLHRRLEQPAKADAYERKLQAFNQDLKLLTDALDEHFKKGQDSDLAYRIASIYLRLGVTSEGLRWLENLRHTDPQDRRSYEALIEYYGKRADSESQRRAGEYRQLLTQLNSS